MGGRECRYREATRECADEGDGVDVDSFAPGTLAELSPGGPFEDEFEGLTVNGRPLPHDVGDQATVVIGREIHGAVDGGTDVDPVRPDVAGEPDIEEVFQGGPTDGRPKRDRQVPHGRGRSPPALDCPRPDRSELFGDLLVGQVGALADLQFIHTVNPMM